MILGTQHSSLRDWHFGYVVELLLVDVLQEEDKISYEMCLCGALGVGIEARNQNLLSARYATAISI